MTMACTLAALSAFMLYRIWRDRKPLTWRDRQRLRIVRPDYARMPWHTCKCGKEIVSYSIGGCSCGWENETNG